MYSYYTNAVDMKSAMIMPMHTVGLTLSYSFLN